MEILQNFVAFWEYMNFKKNAKIHEIKNAWSERISTDYDLHSYVAALRDIFTLKLSQHEGMQNFNR